MKLRERVKNYNRKFKDYPNLFTDEGWIIGYWFIGNYYANETDYYGAFPHSYLERINALFPDCEERLHLFSGSLKDDVEGIRFDIKESCNPDVVGDAHELSEHFEDARFDLIIADPPYSEEDAKHYGTPMVNRNKVVKECTKVLKTDGFLVWLDQVFPMYKSEELDLIGSIGLARSTNHRVRTIFIFRRKARQKKIR